MIVPPSNHPRGHGRDFTKSTGGETYLIITYMFAIKWIFPLQMKKLPSLYIYLTSSKFNTKVFGILVCRTLYVCGFVCRPPFVMFLSVQQWNLLFFVYVTVSVRQTIPVFTVLISVFHKQKHHKRCQTDHAIQEEYHTKKAQVFFVFQSPMVSQKNGSQKPFLSH